MSGVNTARTNHCTFAAKHTVGEHRLHILVALDAEKHLAHAHSAEGRGCAGGAARSAAHTYARIGLYAAKTVVKRGANLVKIDGGTFAEGESEICHSCCI